MSVGAKFFLKEKAAEKKSVQTVEEIFFRNERSKSLLQRFATTDEAATTIAYLYSPLSSATNGTIVKVDGGKFWWDIRMRYGIYHSVRNNDKTMFGCLEL